MTNVLHPKIYSITGKDFTRFEPGTSYQPRFLTTTLHHPKKCKTQSSKAWWYVHVCVCVSVYVCESFLACMQRIINDYTAGNNSACKSCCLDALMHPVTRWETGSLVWFCYALEKSETLPWMINQLLTLQYTFTQIHMCAYLHILCIIIDTYISWHI